MFGIVKVLHFRPFERNGRGSKGVIAGVPESTCSGSKWCLQKFYHLHSPFVLSHRSSEKKPAPSSKVRPLTSGPYATSISRVDMGNGVLRLLLTFFAVSTPTKGAISSGLRPLRKSGGRTLSVIADANI